MMKFPIYGKIKAMFQTTNQLYLENPPTYSNWWLPRTITPLGGLINQGKSSVAKLDPTTHSEDKGRSLRASNFSSEKSILVMNLLGGIPTPLKI